MTSVRNPVVQTATPRKSFQFNTGCNAGGIALIAITGSATIVTHVACPIQKPKKVAG
jgi:hypothetical protein